MATSLYWVGQIPSTPLSMRVYDSQGRTLNLSGYTGFSIRLLGSDNEEIDTTGATLLTSGASTGRFVFRWPTDRSLFNKPGEYVLQLQIDGAGGTKDFTSEHTIKVRRTGGVK